MSSTTLDGAVVKRVAEVLAVMRLMRRLHIPIPEFGNLEVLFHDMYFELVGENYQFSLAVPSDWAESDMAEEYRATFWAVCAIPTVLDVRVAAKAKDCAPYVMFEINPASFDAPNFRTWVDTLTAHLWLR